VSAARPFYVTTPIYYVNDAPHIGHAYTTVIADAVARWHRLMGDETFFLTGTDEHGLKVQRAAEANGVTPREWADRTVERFRDAWKLLNVSYDDFIRTTEQRHYAAVSTFLEKVYENGCIERGVYEGLYCVACEAYYTPDDLLDGGLCPIHQRPVEKVREENYFFKLSAFEQRLLDWYEANPDAVQPESKRNEALGFIRQGLQDFSISRTSINWGVPIPWDSDHVTYVWFDALTNYITAIGYGTDEQRFQTWWPATHLIGKDILRFHCVYWPAMLMAAGLEPPRNLFVHGFLLVGGEKMSKTKLNQIAPADLVEEFGVDGFRYHFLRDTPFGPDGDFSYERMVDRYNADLANNLGNLLSRVSAVVARKCGGVGPAPRPDSPLAAVAAEAYRESVDAWARVQPSVALDATWKVVHDTNAYLEANEPWKLDPGEQVDAVMGDALEALRIVTLLAGPAIPATTEEIWRRIGLPGSPHELRLPDVIDWGGYPGGLEVSKGSPLFPRLQR
jgi:methionyl-tRNA synthetase